MSSKLVARLKDPHMTLERKDGSYDSDRLNMLQEKINKCMTCMCRKPESGGNPFLYGFTLSKPHELATELPGLKDFHTAATDGKKYYWHPDFLEKLTNDEVPTVMEHEGYHVILFHYKRGLDLNHRVFNWAIDYVVNAMVEIGRGMSKQTGSVFGGGLGEPLLLKTLLEYIDAKVDLPDDGKSRCFADKSVHGRSPENIYDEIMKHWEKSPRKCKDCGALSIDPKTGQSKIKKPWDKDACQKCGAKSDPLAAMDGHMQSEATKDEIMADVMRAARQASSLKGHVPSEITDMLGELMSPVLKWQDLVKCAWMRKTQDAGMKNDWKRFRRRYITANPRQYLPRRYTHTPRWLAMIDTSGSMSDDDIVYGISQLKVLGNATEGFIVPCDASPKWDEAVKVTKADDLKRTKIVGRGGTTFDQFFAEYPTKLGKDFDVIIVITDSECGTIPMKYKPPGTDVVWVVTRPGKDYKPSFGRVAPLRPAR